MEFIFFAVGVAMLAYGIYEVVKLRRFLAGAQQTQGTVVGFESHAHSSDGSTSYTNHAVVEFGAAGTTARFVESSTAHGLSEGDSVGVKYDPADLGSARIDATRGLYFRPGVLTATGVAFTVWGFVSL